MAFDSLFIGVTGLECVPEPDRRHLEQHRQRRHDRLQGPDVNFQDLIYQAQRSRRRRPSTTAASTASEVGLGVKIGSIDTDLRARRPEDDRRQHEPRHQRRRLLHPAQAQRQRRAGLHAQRQLLAQPQRPALRRVERHGGSGLHAPTRAATSRRPASPGDITIPLGLHSQAVGTGLNPKLKFGADAATRSSTSRWAAISTRRSGSKKRRACRPARRAPASRTRSRRRSTIRSAAHRAITYTPDAPAHARHRDDRRNAASRRRQPASRGAGQRDGLTAPSTAGTRASRRHDTVTARRARRRWTTSSRQLRVADAGAARSPFGDDPRDARARQAAPAGVGRRRADDSNPARSPAGRSAPTFARELRRVASRTSIRTGSTSTPRRSARRALRAAHRRRRVHIEQRQAVASPTATSSTSARGARARRTTRSRRPRRAARRQTGPIGLDFHNSTSLRGSATANVLAQNGFAAGILRTSRSGRTARSTARSATARRPCSGASRSRRSRTSRVSSASAARDFAATANSGLAQVGTAGVGKLRLDHLGFARAVERLDRRRVHQDDRRRRTLSGELEVDHDGQRGHADRHRPDPLDRLPRATEGADGPGGTARRRSLFVSGRRPTATASAAPRSSACMAYTTRQHDRSAPTEQSAHHGQSGPDRVARGHARTPS